MSRPALSVAGIARAGVAIADAHGLDAVTMRRVATDLGVSAMALYRHVADRHALLLVMARAATSGHRLLPADERPWPQLLTHMADAQWRAFDEHPWLLQIVLTPGRLVNMATPADVERLLTALTAAGLDEDDAFSCLIGVSAAVIGSASVATAARAEPSAPDDDHGPWRGDALATHAVAARFEQHGISDTAARRSLDFVLASFVAGVEQRLTPRPDTGPGQTTRRNIP